MFWWYAAVSCYFQELGLIGRVMSAETDPRAEERPMFRGYEQNFTDNDRGWAWLAGIASCAELVLNLHWSSLPWERHSRELVFLLVPPADLCWGWVWLSLLGLITAVAILTLSNWTAGLSVKCLPVDQAATADLWTELPVSRQHKQELLQRTFLTRSTSPLSFLPTTSGE